MAKTPMMLQYLEIKEQYKDYILFYRLGDFYEMFFDDAKFVSRELDLTLTGRDCGEEERAPMCGVPYHSAETYIEKLISKGLKVAICEQTDEIIDSNGKPIVKREVSRIITPGTVIESNFLNETQNNYLCAICIDAFEAGLSFADISTGEVYATKHEGKDIFSKIINELATYRPSEVILNVSSESISEISDYITEKLGGIINESENIRFDISAAKNTVKEQFSEQNLHIGDDLIILVRSVGALLDYIKETQKTNLLNIKTLNIYSEGQFLELDVNTRRNLELCETMRQGNKKGSLLWVLDRTRTAMGARLLRKWVEHPLINANKIIKRQEAVSELYDNFMKREELSDELKNVLDLERLMTKVVYFTANGKDLRAIYNSISVIPKIKILLSEFSSDEMKAICTELDSLTDIATLIDLSINDDPPFSIREGSFIRDGYNSDVDSLREIMSSGKGWINRIEDKEREKTGIKTLKISSNKVFGYYIEVTNSYRDLVPETYIRKQTLANCERYITEELKDTEATILGASDRLSSLEYELFCEIREKIAQNISRIMTSAFLLSKIDVYLSLADVASRNNYVRPEVDYDSVINIVDGRHPVVELFAKDSYFVPNDTYLNTDNNKFMIITGPNMAGKSTYMRQVAIITLMAQIGSFVPAKEARIGVVDKIFTRVGASDDLASGNSTFMLEMNEVAYILKNATKRSLIIYDEIGRGTSTYDGMSIAKAVAEYTAGKKIGAKTMFATHYHELTSLENEIDGVVNFNIAAKKKGDDITFLRKIIKGAADDSYGIEVAKLAGVPERVVKRAREILKEIEIDIPMVKATDETDNTAITFDDFSTKDVIDKINCADINTMTPIEAMNFIFELKRSVEFLKY